MEKIYKVKFWIISVIAFLAILLGFVTPLMNYQLSSGFINLIGISAAYLGYLYSNSDRFFLYVNQKIQIFLNPKSDWEQTIDIYFVSDNISENFLNDYTNELISNLRRQGVDITRTGEPDPYRSSFKINNPGTRNGQISLTQTEDEKYEVTIEYSGSYSFNQRRDGINEMHQFYNLASRQLIVGEDEKDNRIQLKLFFEKGNPFYGYAVKHIGPEGLSDFKLSLNTIDSINVSATRKYLCLNSNSFKGIEHALKYLVVVPNID